MVIELAASWKPVPEVEQDRQGYRRTTTQRAVCTVSILVSLQGSGSFRGRCPLDAVMGPRPSLVGDGLQQLVDGLELITSRTSGSSRNNSLLMALRITRSRVGSELVDLLAGLERSLSHGRVGDLSSSLTARAGARST